MQTFRTGEMDQMFKSTGFNSQNPPGRMVAHGRLELQFGMIQHPHIVHVGKTPTYIKFKKDKLCIPIDMLAPDLVK